MKQKLLFILDIIFIYLSIKFATIITEPENVNIWTHFTGPTIFTFISIISIFYIFNLYDLQRLKIKGESLIRACTGVVIANIAVAALFYLLGHWQFSQNLFLYQILFTVAFLGSIRYIGGMIFSKIYTDNVMVIGAGDTGKAITDVLGNRLIGYIDDDESKWIDSKDRSSFVTGPISNIENILTENKVRKVILAITHNRSRDLVNTLLKARINGFTIVEMADEYERLTKKVPVHHIHDRWIILEQGFQIYSHEYVGKIKRIMDVLISIIGLILASPIMLIASLLIKLESKGPAFFNQKRVGLNDKEFTIYKLRSMKNDAEKNGAVWAKKNDNRVTKLGRFIRKVRIDELPQLWNILKGDMSLIGPRPERMVFVKELEEDLPYYYIRHTIKPGLTGWAQINYPYGATKEDALHKLEYELYYIKNMSILFDIKIMLKTIGVMLFGQGGR